MNKYGYFKYSDFAVGAKKYLTYSTNATLQTGSALTDLSVGVLPYDFASFEQDEYVTTKPKKLYDLITSLGFLTADISDENGDFATPITITADFSAYFSMTGITISSRNIIKGLNITAYRDNVEIVNKNFSAANKEEFYTIDIVLANKIVFTVTKIDKPYHFLGLFGIDFGKIRIFDETQQISAQITQNFSVLGNTLEYDTLDLSIIEQDEGDYLFQKKQPIDYFVGEQKKVTFYVDNGVKNDDNTVKVTAYDEIANLEDNFLGGMYENYPFNDLLNDIFANTDIDFETTVETENINLNGYLPITSRRKALQTILEASNIRCYKGEKLFFKPLESVLEGVILDETNIIDRPQKTKKQEIKSVTVNQKVYSRGTEEAEAYHWYVSTTQDILLTFSSPLHSLKAYEVTGVDGNGNDIVSETESANVQFLEAGANYCVVRNRSANKIVIKGQKYIESTVEYKRINPLTALNESYENINIELTISANPQEVCDLLYNLYSRKNSIRFITLEPLKIGGYYSILGENLNIKSITHSLNGLYEVEAV